MLLQCALYLQLIICRSILCTVVLLLYRTFHIVTAVRIKILFTSTMDRSFSFRVI